MQYIKNQIKGLNILLVVMISLSFTILPSTNAFAENLKSSKSFDSHRPDNVSVDKWAMLKSAAYEAKLLPTPTGVSGDNSLYGSSVSIDGNRALIGATEDLGHGAAYILDYDGNNWVETAILLPSDLDDSTSFGISVSLSGDRALIGTSLRSVTDNGTQYYSIWIDAAYIFELVNGNWIQTAKLTALDHDSSFSGFGSSVSLLGDRALIGALADDDNGTGSGSAYIFDFNGNSWVETVKIHASDAAVSEKFGSSVSLSGDRALIGAPKDFYNGFKSGSAYVFDLNSNIWSQSQKLSPNDGAEDDIFGSSVSMSGDRIVIGAPSDDDNGDYSGSAYIFTWNGNNWTQSIKLIAEDSALNTRFGSSVSLSGSRALIGSSRNFASVFDYNGVSWQETFKLIANDADINSPNGFGQLVSLSGDKLLVGAPNDGRNKGSGNEVNYKGAAYVFDFNGSSWSQTSKVTATEGATGDNFGFSTSLSGDFALIGAPHDNNNGINSGAAYIFSYSNDSWLLMEKLLASDGESGDEFGLSVSLSGNRALVGIGSISGGNSREGSAYIYELIDGAWPQVAKLTASDSTNNNRFGRSVSLFGNRALIGSSTNSAYIFDFIGGNWLQTTKLLANDASIGDAFGASVSLSNNRALIGAWLDSTNLSQSGSAYIFDFDGINWSETIKLNANIEIEGSRFGNSVSLSGDRALIGAHLDNVNGINSGSAYIFDFDGTNWSETIKLIPSDGSSSKQFGLTVSLSGDKALIGSYPIWAITTEQVPTYIYEFNGSNWLENQIFTDAGLANEGFGVSVSLSGDNALIGSYRDNDRGIDSGSAYIVDVNPSFNISVTVSGLDLNSSIEVVTNGQAINFTGPGGPISFNSPFNNNTSYAVSISSQPTSPNQLCIVNGGNSGDDNGSGTIDGSEVSISIMCALNPVTQLERNVLLGLYIDTGGSNWIDNSNWLDGDPCNDNWYGVVCEGNKISEINLGSDNNLIGSIPQNIDDLSNLKILALNNNQLTGEIPQQLSNLSSLQSLTLSSNNFVGVIPSTLVNLSSLGSGGGTALDIRWNGLYTTSNNLNSFLINHQLGGDWSSSQTIAPNNLTIASTSSNTISLNWDLINYQLLGGYKIYMATNANGPFNQINETISKSVTAHILGGLTTGQNYYFRISSFTYPHDNNTNFIDSEMSEVVFAAPTVTEATADLYTIIDTTNSLFKANYNSNLFFPELGDTLSYTITVGNNGPDDSLNSHFKHNFPTGVINGTWSCSVNSGSATCPSLSGVGNIDELLQLPNNSSLMFVFSAEIVSSDQGELIVTATVIPPEGINDTDLVSNTQFQNFTDLIYDNGFE